VHKHDFGRPSTAGLVDVPHGFRQTEVGIIPEDWDCVTVDQVGTVKGGKRLPFGHRLVDNLTPHPYIRVSDMVPGGVDTSGIVYVPEQAFGAIRNYRVFSDDIFISVAGTLGIVGVVPPELSGANLTENADRITDLKCHRDYLLYWLMSRPVQQTIQSIQTVGAQPKLALGRIAKFLIALPSNRSEQHAIAAALSDVDGQIAALNKLIAKKMAIKQATMQQLLTGKTRQPRFSGEWQQRQLGEIVSIQKGQLITEQSVVPGTVPVVAGGKRPAYFHNRANRTGKTITVSASGANAGFVAFYDVPIFASDCSTISESPSYSLEFLYYQMLLLQGTIYGTQSGGAQPHVHPTDLMPLEIVLPPLAEQQAIATALSDIDAEIAALERRRDKTQQIKRGMMQQLLTGRTRLV